MHKSGPEKVTKTGEVRFVTDKSRPERITKTRGNDSLWKRFGQNERPRCGGTICLRIRATKTGGYDLLRTRVGQEESPTLGVRFIADKSGPERATKTRGRFITDKNGPKRQDPAIRFVMDKSGPEGATKNRRYDLVRIRVGQKEPPIPGGTICCG